MTSPRCSEELHPGFQCTREPHDDEMHQYDGDLPPIVNQLVAAAVDDLEQHIVILDRWTHRAKIAWRWAIFAGALNLGAMFWSLARIAW